MSDDHYVRGKTKEELLSDLHGTAEVASSTFEQLRMGILVRCTEDIEQVLAQLGGSAEKLRKSIESGSSAAYKLSAMVTVLYIVIALAAVANVVIALYKLS